MGDLLDKAFETPAVILTDGNQVTGGLVTSTADDAWIAEPDAPIGSIHYKTDGTRQTRMVSTGSGVADDWASENPLATGGGASVSFAWRFSTSTVEADPGNARIRFDNATPASVTKIFVDDFDTAGIDVSGILNSLPIGTKIYLQQQDVSANYLIATTTGITDNIGWFTLDVTIDDSGTLPANNKVVGVLFFAGGGAGVSTFLALTDTPGSYAGAGGDFVAVNGAENALEFVPPADMSSVQASRTTDFSISATPTDITLDQTDVENDATVIEHDNTNTERIVVKEDGLYLVLYHMTGVADSGVSEASAEIIGDIHVNGGGTAIPGSTDIVKTFFDGSIINDDLEVNIVGQVLYEATANDYFTVQAHEQAVSGTISLVAKNVSLRVIRLKGPRGVKGADGADGAPGSGSTITLEDEGTPVTNTPHDTINFVGSGVTVSDNGDGSADVTIPGGGGAGIDAVQARRSTTFTLTGGATWDDIAFNQTDVETDAAVIEHNNTNTDNVDVKATAVYEINYHVPIDTTGLGNGDTWDIRGRIRVNDAGVAMNGSQSFVTAWQDSSVDGSDFGYFLDKTVIVSLTASDFVTLQIQAIDNSSDGGVIGLLAQATITVKRLK